MRKLLIVDDDGRNREFITTLCADYAEEHGIRLQLFEASSGYEAVTMCEELRIDIVFMDIMMPGMDGIEASRIIREKLPKTMIVAISAAEDEEYKNRMLQAGAEDYVAKPVVSSLFFKRLGNYLKIYELRQQNSAYYDSAAINLYTKHLYSFHLRFSVRNEEALAQFWERMLIVHMIQNSNEHFSDLIRVIYAVGSVLLQKKCMFIIEIEEDEQYHYFTLNHMSFLDKDHIVSKLDKNCPLGEYRFEGDYLSFRIPIRGGSEEAAVETRAAAVMPEAVTVHFEEPAAAQPVSAVKTAPEAPAALQVFDFMQDHHLDDLQNAAKQLDSAMLYLTNAAISEEEVEDIVHLTRVIADILNIYNEVYTIGEAVESLSNVIEEQKTTFQERSKELAELFYAFVRDLNIWIETLFITGAPDLHYLDASIVTNAQMIQSFLRPQSEEDIELDDIFDF